LEVILWTIQTAEAWQTLQRKGVLRPESHHVEQRFLESYKWLVTQMCQRIGPQPADCDFPVWAWYQWYDCRRPRPDLRFGAHLPKGTEGFRLEIELSHSQVLLSDFELWHYVLNYHYLPESEEDGEAFDAELEQTGLCPCTTKPLPHRQYDQRVRDSWLRIFDLGWSAKAIASPMEDKSIQAVFWELQVEQIKSAQRFIAR
jgi:hypothetical protein